MNREEIEKTIDGEFPDGFEKYVTTENIKSFFFDTILPEVLRDIIEIPKIDVGEENTLDNSYERGIVFGVNARTGKFIVDAKEKYNITL